MRRTHNQTDTKALALHKKHRGKLEIKSTVPLRTKEDLSLAYTPGVAAVCRAIAENKDRVRDYTMKKNMIAVVSDGSAILGLGNLGPEAALPVMEGKAILFKQFAGVDAFPICLATQDTEEIIRTVKYLAPGFGGINLEDISAPRCFEIEEQLRRELDIPVFHDDQHGTAVVVLAGLVNALTLRDLSPKEARIVVNGAGAAGTAITKLLLTYGFKNIMVIDRTGIIEKGRANLHQAKLELAKITNPEGRNGGLADALKDAHVFIGVSAAGALSPELVGRMAERPVIFAMANPIPEIMPEEARKAGAYIVATGRSDFPNQVNNVLAFPGIFRGVLDNNIIDITPGMLMLAAHALAACVARPTPVKILPDPFDKKVPLAIADAFKKAKRGSH